MSNKKQDILFFILMFIMAFAIVVGATGCYGEKKARQQFAKAAVAYPEIPAEYCANEFPVKDSVIRDTTTISDTLIVTGLSDTVFIQDFDTVRMIITKTLPGKIITNTVHITDTIIRENTASVKACEIDKSKLTGLLEKKTGESDRWQGKYKKTSWIMWGLIALIISIIGLNIYLRSKKIIK